MLAICDVFSNQKGYARALREFFAGLHFRFADTIDDGESTINACSFAVFRKLHHRPKAVFAKLRTANFLIVFSARRVQGNVDFIHLANELGDNVALVDERALSVGV